MNFYIIQKSKIKSTRKGVNQSTIYILHLNRSVFGYYPLILYPRTSENLSQPLILTLIISFRLTLCQLKNTTIKKFPSKIFVRPRISLCLSFLSARKPDTVNASLLYAARSPKSTPIFKLPTRFCPAQHKCPPSRTPSLSPTSFSSVASPLLSPKTIRC